MNNYNQDYMHNRSCAICGKRPVEFHHAIYRRNKNIPELNEPENLLPLCVVHHKIFEAGGYEYRCRAWQMKVDEFGFEHMTDWHEKLPMKVKERFE